MSRGPSKENRKRQLKTQRSKAKRLADGHAVLRGKIDNNQCMLELSVVHPGGIGNEKPIKAIIDTGATNSTIHPRIAQELQLPTVGQVNCRTVHGMKVARMVAVRIRVSDGNKRAARTITAIVPDEQTDEMLFGMDAMTGGVLTVDTNKKTWVWRLTNLR